MKKFKSLKIKNLIMFSNVLLYCFFCQTRLGNVFMEVPHNIRGIKTKTTHKYSI